MFHTLAFGLHIMAKAKKPVSKGSGSDESKDLNYEQIRAAVGWINFRAGCSVKLLPILAQRFLGIRDQLVQEKTVLQTTRKRVESNIDTLTWLLEQVEYDDGASS